MLFVVNGIACKNHNVGIQTVDKQRQLFSFMIFLSQCRSEIWTIRMLADLSFGSECE